MKRRLYLLFFILLSTGLIQAQTKKVLFIGNSYTGVNNLPKLVSDVALSVGDVLIFDAHTPGGSRLMNHSSDSVAIAKIYSNNWDHIVIQAQSQEPSWDSAKVANEVFPHAKILADTARANDSCTKPIFYMTWGRENGDAANCATWPWVCTYEGMDSVLNKNYRKMAEDNNGLVSPVGAVWNYLRNNHPSLQLYSADGSHPSPSGSYATAVAFYCMIFKKDPTALSFDFNLPAADASIIRAAAKLVAFDSLVQWGRDTTVARAAFQALAGQQTPTTCPVILVNNSKNAKWYEWDFGDGSPNSNVENPTHHYYSNGAFSIKLTAKSCGQIDSTKFTVNIDCGFNLDENSLKDLLKFYPNPTKGILNLDQAIIDQIDKLEILNGMGKLLKSMEKSKLYEPIKLYDLSAGHYILIFRFKDGRIENRSLIVLD